MKIYHGSKVISGGHTQTGRHRHTKIGDLISLLSLLGSKLKQKEKKN
jgi:hypothetical protein